MISTPRSELLVDQERLYALTRDRAGQLYLEIVTGGIAMETVVLPLSQEEVTLYEECGKEVLNELALRVLKQRSRFESRLLRV